MIKVNGKDFPIYVDTISYDEVVRLAFPDCLSKYLTIIWLNGHASKPEGILAYSQSVPIKNGMRFTVADTSNA